MIFISKFLFRYEIKFGDRSRKFVFEKISTFDAMIIQFACICYHKRVFSAIIVFNW